jgi:hypothetical protein
MHAPQIFPVFTLQCINQMERLFLAGIKYNLFISGSQYAHYYFNLRAQDQQLGLTSPRH